MTAGGKEAEILRAGHRKGIRAEELPSAFYIRIRCPYGLTGLNLAQ